MPVTSRSPVRAPSSGARSRVALALCVGLVAGSVLVGCGGEKTIEITDTREGMPRDRTAPPDATTASRLGFRATPEAAPRGDLQFDVPTGWEPLPNRPMVKAGFRLGGDPDTECTLVTLPGSSGGALANVNRWRKQMGLGPIDEAALAALPKGELLGRPALLVDLSGTYGGMSGELSVAGARLLGALAELPSVSVFVKLVGNGAVVDSQRENFTKFVRSIRMGQAAAPHGGGAPQGSGSPQGSGGPASGAVRWTVPEGFEQGPDRDMRIVTLTPKGANDVEIVLSSFPGNVGGLLANVNRWRTQMGLDPLDETAVAALPRRKMLGGAAVLVDLTGHYSDKLMSDKKIEGAKFVGLVFERSEDTLFVKMTGPAAAVDAARPGFDAFVASLAPEAPK